MRFCSSTGLVAKSKRCIAWLNRTERSFIFLGSSSSSSFLPLFRYRETRLAKIIIPKPTGYTHFHAFEDRSSWDGPPFGFAQARLKCERNSWKTEHTYRITDFLWGAVCFSVRPCSSFVTGTWKRSPVYGLRPSVSRNSGNETHRGQFFFDSAKPYFMLVQKQAEQLVETVRLCREIQESIPVVSVHQRDTSAVPERQMRIAIQSNRPDIVCVLMPDIHSIFSSSDIFRKFDPLNQKAPGRWTSYCIWRATTDSYVFFTNAF